MIMQLSLLDKLINFLLKTKNILNQSVLKISDKLLCIKLAFSNLIE